MEGSYTAQLRRLAGSYGVETSYRSAAGIRHQATPDSLLAALQALGTPVEGMNSLEKAMKERQRQIWQSCLEPVTVAWAGYPAWLLIRIPAQQVGGQVDLLLQLENGEEMAWHLDLNNFPDLRGAFVDGKSYVCKRLPLPGGLPWGYHEITIAVGGQTQSGLLIVAPLRSYGRSWDKAASPWGVFIPLYALRSRRSWAAGDLADLAELVEWSQGLGGSLVGMLPLYANFLDQPFDPSPYAPVSRLFWNEFYLALTDIPELEMCQQANELLNSPRFQAEIADLRSAPLVDYRRGMAAKRQVLELFAQEVLWEESRRRDLLLKWAEANPAARDYARFRAAVEKTGSGWPAWPKRLRDGQLEEGDFDPASEWYHLYVQWVFNEQIENISKAAQERGVGLYLDFPLGVHGAGYDVWRHREVFALGARSGAPPDLFFAMGQDWGFPPLHPERIRQGGYRYLIDCLRHSLRRAGFLRLDHVMGLHRLFWIPEGVTAREGVYVRYRAEELYAILSLESHRHQTLLIGEDLGTVPPGVRTAMGKHNLSRMYILPGEFRPGRRQVLRPVPARTLAGLNTHDMPTFNSFWQGKSWREQRALSSFLMRKGLIRQPLTCAKTALRACLKYLSRSRNRLLLINLEDLWLEPAPQNIPGTVDEYPNWRRKALYFLEEFDQIPHVKEILHGKHGDGSSASF